MPNGLWLWVKESLGCGREKICGAPYVSSRPAIELPARASAAVAVWLGAHPADAAPPQVQIPTEEQLQPGEEYTPAGGGFLSGLARTAFLFGNMGGLRPFLAQYGISIALQETSEVLGNVSGGIHKGADYDGLTQMLMQLDTRRAFDWYGGTFNVSALQIHGRNLSADNLGTLQTASGIESDRATRLWELWYDQKIPRGRPRADIKVGQQSLDQEFMVTQNGLLFVNTMFGWPMVPSADLPGGGPAYPLSALGVRGRWRPVDPAGLSRRRIQRQPGQERRRLAIRNSPTPPARASRQMAAPWRSPRCNIPTRRSAACCTPIRRSRWPASISSASGTTASISPISALTIPACRWPIREAPAFRSSIAAITASMRPPTR